MQGNESKIVILDFVLAKKRIGKLGFVTNRGRINVSMSHAQYFQVFVGDLAATAGRSQQCSLRVPILR